jgi:glycolate oxidase FAD binding subunit
VYGPTTAEELAGTLRRLALHDCLIELRGCGTKRRMGGAIQRPDETITVAGLRRLRQYEPRDLTISVEAGMPWRELTGRLQEHRQMIPLDPPFADTATVGGVVAANCSGPRRRLYGTARDLIIGMQFATLEGNLVDTGGMVVKNVAGLDMGKLMIGSFGTLAAIASVNFKLLPMPPLERSFLLAFSTAAEAIAARDQIGAAALDPAALDLLNPAAGTSFGNRAWMLAVRAAGNAAAINRYERELAPLGAGVALDEDDHNRLWRRLEEYTPGFLAAHPDGAVVRVSCTLKEVAAVMEQISGPAVARAGVGVCYGYFEEGTEAAAWLAEAAVRGWKAVIEFGPDERQNLEMWPAPGSDLELMRRIKGMFDPANLLNRGRLYQRI